jgi:aryl-alcohol dehydrogenase-like predicted oxidoreductase
LKGDTETNEAITPERIAKVRLLADLAKELGLTTPQLSIAYLLTHKEVSSVITGATRLSQLEQNLKAADVVEKLTPDVMDSLVKILGPAAAE